jgi:hypothetical protein
MSIKARIVAHDGPVLYAQVELSAEADVSKTAWDFARALDTGYTDLAVVSTFVTREGDKDFPPGVWILGLDVSPEMRKDVEAGKLSALELAVKVVKPASAHPSVNEQARSELRAALGLRGFGRRLMGAIR